MLIIPILLSTSLLVTPAKDTVWWNTPGGNVTEHRDQSGINCSLMLYDDAGSVIFEWNNPGKTSVTVVDWDWQFPDAWPLPVAMQVGDTWLSNGGASAILQGVGHGTTVNFPMNQSVDDLLRPADHILVKTTAGELSIKLNRTKTGVLLSHAHECRDVMRR